MAAQDLHPTDLTDSERDAGFVLTTIDNPLPRPGGHPRTVRAVVLELSPTCRVVKLRLAEGRVGFQLQRYGRYPHAPDRPPEWLPDSNCAIPDPATAVEYFDSGLAGRRGFGRQIVEASAR